MFLSYSATVSNIPDLDTCANMQIHKRGSFIRCLPRSRTCSDISLRLLTAYPEKTGEIILKAHQSYKNGRRGTA